LGAALAWLASLVLGRVVGAWSFRIEPWSIGLGFALALVTGVAFGLNPARRAARVDPIRALRSE
jgi:putative ABC transport system permease protein